MTNKQNSSLFIIDLRGMKGLFGTLRDRLQQLSTIQSNSFELLTEYLPSIGYCTRTLKFSALKEFSVLGGDVSLSYETE